MPYKAFKKNDEWCVYKLDSSDSPTGGSLGCHPSRDKANAQVRALYASEKEIAMDDEKAKINYAARQDLPDSAFALVRTDKNGKRVRKYIISDASHTRVALARAAQQDDEDAKRAMPKILAAAKKFGIKVSKKEVDMDEIKARDIPLDEEKEMYVTYEGEIRDSTEYVPYGVTSMAKYDEVVTAKKMAEETKKEVKVFKEITENIIENPDVEDKPNAIMLLAKEFVSRLRSRTSSINDFFNKPKEKEADYSLENPFTVFKDKDGNPRWIARYSNDRRDQDNPPEIISNKSHQYFEEMVDKGLAPLPELWIWHMPLKLGKAEVVTFDKENGIAIAAGSFNDNAKEFAQLIADNPDEWGVSHGMPGQFIERDEKDRTVITKHITKEISVLPKYAAANKWADFQVLKEVDMTIRQDKLDQLKNLGASEQLLADLQDGNKDLNDALEELGVERKEANEPEQQEEAVEEKETETAVEEVVEEKEVEQEDADEKEQEQDLRLEIADALKEIGVAIASLNERIDGLEKEQEVEQKSLPEEVEDMPQMSLKEFLIRSMATNKENSVTKSDDAVLDGRTTLAKDGPEETQPRQPSIISLGDPLMESVITGIALGNQQPA